jgi:HEPN domain-containing protein
MSSFYLDDNERRLMKSAELTLESAKRDLEFGDYSWTCFKTHQAVEKL